MQTLEVASVTVGDLVAQRPSRARVFEQLGIDYCCGGRQPLAEACAARELTLDAVQALLDQEAAEPAEPAVDAASMSLTALADHIQATHHAYLVREFPRLELLLGKVIAAHGDRDARLQELAGVLAGFISELQGHMFKEEQILFPMIRELDRDGGDREFHCGTIANPIRVMEIEHNAAGDALQGMRSLTDGFTPPTWACNTYRALLDGLASLERDMHQHVHKENNILFPRALRREGEARMTA